MSLSHHDILHRLAQTIDNRKSTAPANSYVAKLLHKGTDAVLKKIGEEAVETIMAVKDGDPQKIIYEMADLWFHCLIVLSQQGLSPDAVLQELVRREGLSGLEEFAARQPQ